MLKRLDWSEYNYNRLVDLIEKYKSASEISKYNRNYIVSDWDNTSAMFDVEDAVFLYQLMNLEYRCDVESFKNILIKDIDSEEIDFINELTDEICIKFNFLMDLKNKLSIDVIKKYSEYNDFIAMMTYLYGEFSVSLSYRIQCYRILYLFQGFSEKDLRRLASDTIDYWMGQDLKEMSFSCIFNGMELKSSYNTGLRSVPEITDLYSNLRKNNIDVYICSASSKIVVEEFATSEKYGYGCKKDDVAGLVLKKGDDGKYISEIDTSYIQTFLEGKAEYIDSLKSLYKKSPILTMGDSSGDYYLLTYKRIVNGIIFNRKTSGNINELKEESQIKDSIYLLQNRDTVKGCLRE